MTSLIGQTINNRYRVEAELGDGGMGAVYRAYDLNLDRQVAIKLMHAQFARQGEFRARLIQEAQTAAKLDHPSVVQIYDFGNSELGLFIAMEFVSGGSLRDHLKRLQTLQKYLPLSQSLQIGAQIADALDYAHRRGIIHRDIKPGNVLLKKLSHPDAPGEQPFRAMLTDFGLVKLQAGSDMTQSGATLGTPTYMSPEQCAGEELDGRADIYSLGVVLYELVTNRLPFNMRTLTEAIAVHTKGEMPPPARSVRADIPPIIDAIISKAMAKQREVRYADAGELTTALQGAIVALEGAPTQIMHREEMDILEQVKEPPYGYELHIETPGHPTSVFSMTKPVVTLGRNADNDVVLPADGVSRHHARLQATALGWEVVDLGGINGTWLDERRLRASDSTPIGPGSRLRIGPYELVLQGPEIAIQELDFGEAEVVSGSTTPALEENTAVANTAPSPQEPLAIFLPVDTISVGPGQTAELKVEIVNRSGQSDRISLRVQGVPASWVKSPGEFVTLMANDSVQLTIQIQPPRQRGTPTGRQRLRLELVSQKHPDLNLGTNASLLVGGFVAFEARIDPEQVRLPGIVTVVVENTGNEASDFSIVARDRQQAIRFYGEKGRIRLEPGQIANVELKLEARQKGIFSSGELYPFEVEVLSTAGGRQVLAGEVRPGAVIPPGILYALIFVVTFACVIGALALLSKRQPLFGRTTETPTALVDMTGTAVAATETIVAATSLAGTAVVAGDVDGDGLSDAQEIQIKTDPNNPDSDGDGISDGDEVLIYGTDPLHRDTDGDILSDWDEINVYKTDPRKADTDGDGIPDGTELTQGSDPLVAETPTPGPTATETATVLVTPSDTPSPSLTPTITNTPLPSTTPTHTPTATNTPTPTQTQPPTATPTHTNTPTITPTATNTPLPVPSLACLATPPVIDGSFQITEWPGTPLFQFKPDDNAARLVQVYAGRDAAQYYLAFLINDDTADASDSLRLYFDTTNNGGDPDTADRFFQLGRDKSMSIWAGTGSNSDGQNWNANYTSNNWTAVIAEPGGNQWVVEMAVSTAELNALTNPFGLMAQVVYTGDLATWPEDAVGTNPNTWQDVNNVTCP